MGGGRVRKIVTGNPRRKELEKKGEEGTGWKKMDNAVRGGSNSQGIGQGIFGILGAIDGIGAGDWG